VYLLHPLLVEVYYHVPWLHAHHPFWLQLLLAAAFLAVTIGICSATYLLVERPMQDLGRRVAKWADARFGPDRAPAREPVLTPRAHPATD
jgi:peptidoglycan/LPS O-acetylase OafA/YrhL